MTISFLMRTELLENKRRGRIQFKPTPEQEKAIEDYRRNRKANGNSSGPISIFETGFIYPSQIVDHTCFQCTPVQTYSRAPKIEIHIQDIPPTINIGALCPQGHFVLNDFLKEDADFPREFVVFDATGDYKIPTPESIENMFSEIESHANRGMRVQWEEKILQRWAGKIGYSLDQKRLETAMATARRVYLENFANGLPEFLERVRELEFGFNLTAFDSVTNFEGTGLSSYMQDLLKNLPEINLPKDPRVRQD